MADVSDLVSYYQNLLIIQYNNQPNARAKIALLAEILLASGILFDIQNAYNLTGDNTAVGAQLDVLGKYAGVNRSYSDINLTEYFSLVSYTESIPSAPARGGFETYATFGTQNDYNGTVTYNDILTAYNNLLDEYYLPLIQFAIVQNNSNGSQQQIDDSLFTFFGTSIRAEYNGPMQIAYFIAADENALVAAAIEKNLLPKPLGRALRVVDNISEPMFAFTDYSGYESVYGYGFSTYANYSALAGQVLTYSQIN